jgi:poly(A) polymerase Pap1
LTTAGFIKEISPDQRVREKRRRTIAKVESSIRNHFGQEFCIGTFGSTQYGVDGPTSDLDLVVIVGIFLMFHLQGSESATGPRKDVRIRP